MIWAPAARRSAGARLLTEPWVATAMKAGVSTAPRGVSMRPRRAPPSVRSSAKAKSVTSEDQHGVAVRIEPVAEGDGVPVGVEGEVDTAERGDEQEQGRSREVEVRDQPVDDPEAVAGMDEEISAAPARANTAALAGRPLERASRGGADGDDPPALGA